MTRTERAQTLAQHAIATAQAVAEHMAAMPPRTPAVLVWRRRCRARQSGRAGCARRRYWAAINKARGFGGAHAVHAVQGAVLAVSAQVKAAQIFALPAGAVTHRSLRVDAGPPVEVMAVENPDGTLTFTVPRAFTADR